MFNKSIFIFRRDLRIQDNLGLIYACKNSKYVMPIFIFTPEQIENNSFKSDNAVQFMIESLEELAAREDEINELTTQLHEVQTKLKDIGSKETLLYREHIAMKKTMDQDY